MRMILTHDEFDEFYEAGVLKKEDKRYLYLDKAKDTLYIKDIKEVGDECRAYSVVRTGKNVTLTKYDMNQPEVDLLNEIMEGNVEEGEKSFANIENNNRHEGFLKGLNKYNSLFKLSDLEELRNPGYGDPMKKRLFGKTAFILGLEPQVDEELSSKITSYADKVKMKILLAQESPSLFPDSFFQLSPDDKISNAFSPNNDNVQNQNHEKAITDGLHLVMRMRKN